MPITNNSTRRKSKVRIYPPPYAKGVGGVKNYAEPMAPQLRGNLSLEFIPPASPSRKRGEQSGKAIALLHPAKFCLSQRSELDRRPDAYEAPALPTELRWQNIWRGKVELHRRRFNFSPPFEGGD